ncbi:MAG: hydantoinase B/oxoprolinase family protein [Deltaproteobacteria bacterium]|nr:hydantoinase B/oxoprolinase family protein [Deltaproteobacteria bacterium]MBW2152666.1 hydantoinase B/oxoprolinase family protein [Deltaproteobacteria bacterium]
MTIEVVNERGTILNPNPPAPVAGRSDTDQRVVDGISRCYGQGDPRAGHRGLPRHYCRLYGAWLRFTFKRIIHLF